MKRAAAAFSALALCLTPAAATAGDPPPPAHAAEVLSDPGYQRELPGLSGENAASTDGAKAPPVDRAAPSPDEDLSSAPSPLAPVAQFLLWGLLAVAVVLVIGWIGREIARARRGASAEASASSDGGVLPLDAPARPIVLSEAEALAAAGRFAEAVHALLAASIRRLVSRRDVSVDDASTAREVLRAAPLEADAKRALEELVLGVEISFFGGAPVHEAEFVRALAAYRRVEAALP